MVSKDYYQILEIPRNATEEQVRAAFVAKEATIEQGTQARFDLIEAYTFLSDSKNREMYDTLYDQERNQALNSPDENINANPEAEISSAKGKEPRSTPLEHDDQWLKEHLDHAEYGHMVKEMLKLKAKQLQEQQATNKPPETSRVTNILTAIFLVIVAFFSIKSLYNLIQSDVETVLIDWTLPVGGVTLVFFATIGWLSEKFNKKE